MTDCKAKIVAAVKDRLGEDVALSDIEVTGGLAIMPAGEFDLVGSLYVYKDNAGTVKVCVSSFDLPAIP